MPPINPLHALFCAPTIQLLAQERSAAGPNGGDYLDGVAAGIRLASDVISADSERADPKAALEADLKAEQLQEAGEIALFLLDSLQSIDVASPARWRGQRLAPDAKFFEPLRLEIPYPRKELWDVIDQHASRGHLSHHYLGIARGLSAMAEAGAAIGFKSSDLQRDFDEISVIIAERLLEAPDARQMVPVAA